MIYKFLKRILNKSKTLLKLLGQKPINLDGYYINSAAQLISFLSDKFNQGLMSSDNIEVARQRLERGAKIAMPKILGVYSYDFSIELKNRTIKARYYRSFDSIENKVSLLFFHGGGFVLGSIDSHDATIGKIAKKTGFSIISINYRLAPEHPFPAAVEDAVDSFKWLIKNANEFDIDPKHIVVAGDSAGGNLAAVVAQQAKGDRIPPLAQVLIYPVLDFHFTSNSHKTFSTGFFLSNKDMEHFRQLYLTEPTLADNYLVSPLLNPDLSNLAPALIVTAGFDPLRDDGAKYASILQKNGVKTLYKCYHDMIHGFIGMGILPNGLQLIDDVAYLIKSFTTECLSTFSKSYSRTQT